MMPGPLLAVSVICAAACLTGNASTLHRQPENEHYIKVLHFLQPSIIAATRYSATSCSGGVVVCLV
jgi:hypothetical protein